ncbi:thiamine pyrophosphate-dependent dehydrogenase E1 component subunit alpha [Baekduia soli]|nr:thiamine pyrophosphate-dependent dehydrogenase E1 component subunit alpha [Baekduia soli]
MDAHRAVSEVLGRVDGPAHGRGGHMHLVDVAAGVGGTNGIVGAGLPLAVGAAYALHVRRTGNVAVSCFGDGATNTGAFHEALNLAVVWRLPVVFVCEDNGFTEAMTSADITAATGLVQRAAAYTMPAAEVDGGDVEAVHAAALEAMARARAGEGPSAIVAHVNRTRGHWSGDTQHYRDKEDIAARAAHDPTEAAMAAAGLDDAEIAALVQAARERAQAIVDAVVALPPPDRELLLADGDDERSAAA